jgi:hypothetical protein
MMGRLGLLSYDCRGAAAAEMALVLPLLLIILFGSLELGNYFMNEHTLVKAVRDGARFAGRQTFTNYTSCSGSPGGTVLQWVARRNRGRGHPKHRDERLPLRRLNRNPKHPGF